MSDKFKCDVKLSVGDIVVFDHLVCQDMNKFSDTVFFCEYFNIFAKIDGDDLVPIEEFLFCEPIVDGGMQIGCFNVPSSISDKRATVYAASAYAKACGVIEGDVVYFTKNADYSIEVGGKDFFKMKMHSIIGIEREGVLTTFGSKLLVKNVTELGMVGGLNKIYADTSLQVGVVIESGASSIEKGAKVTYFNASATEMEWNDEKYGFINEENIKYIIK
jgi:co-chaperonin GroES (HSP10)